jgi:tetratricopeptide repeat protein
MITTLVEGSGQELGQVDDLPVLAERALRIDEPSTAPDHTTVATDLNNLAGILHTLGEPGVARPLAERALQIGETVSGRTVP